METEFYVGRRLSYDGNLCSVRYIGEVHGTKGMWLGVEWDDLTRGKHSGEHEGVRYFECVRKHSTAGSFVRPTRPCTPRLTFLEALHKKYVSEESGGRKSHVGGAPVAAQSIKISGKQVEEIGFDKVRLQLANLRELKFVLLDGMCVHQPTSSKKSNEISQVCPKITELDLSRNVFEAWLEVIDIISQLTRLRSLKLSGNRFCRLDTAQIDHATVSFPAVTELSVDDTLLDWTQITNLVATCFPKLASLSASDNAFTALSADAISTNPLPGTITSVALDANLFTSIEDVAPLAGLRKLQRLSLKNNLIQDIASTETDVSKLVFPLCLSEIDLSFNHITSWSFIDRLQDVFPGMTALRVSHNPLYPDVRASGGNLSTPEKGYMLTVARLPHLKTLNFSPITPKERLDAEAYYLSLIAAELSAMPPDHASTIIAQHRRYAELCQEYGEPVIRRKTVGSNLKSLASRLMRCNFRLAEPAQRRTGRRTPNVVFKEIPKSVSVYTLLGIVARIFELSPTDLRLVCETGEWDPKPRVGLGPFSTQAWDFESSDSDNDSDSGAEEGHARGRDTKLENTLQREVVLIAGTRPLGQWIEGDSAIIRVELR